MRFTQVHQRNKNLLSFLIRISTRYRAVIRLIVWNVESLKGEQIFFRNVGGGGGGAVCVDRKNSCALHITFEFMKSNLWCLIYGLKYEGLTGGYAFHFEKKVRHTNQTLLYNMTLGTSKQSIPEGT